MQITDPKAIRALAHPLRLDLLDLLVAIGPATAARCGRILGVPQANCSFHLRQLARYGFVADGGPGRDRRERRWLVPDPRLRLPGGDAVTLQFRQLVIEREMQVILDHAERSEDESPAWRDKAGIVSGVAVMSAEEAADIKQKWRALLEPYFARAVASGLRLQPGQRYVRYLMAGTPLPEPGRKDDENASDDD